MAPSFVHFEIPADNVDRASTFYRKTFDWSIEKLPGMEYAVVRTDLDGSESSPEEVPPSGGIGAKKGTSRFPHLTIVVDDLDSVLEKVPKNGGKIVEPKHPMGEVGFSAAITDPEGNTIGLYQPTSGE